MPRRSTPATARSASSPATWPRRSFSSLKSSRSASTSANSTSGAASISASDVSWKRRWFQSPSARRSPPRAPSARACAASRARSRRARRAARPARTPRRLDLDAAARARDEEAEQLVRPPASAGRSPRSGPRARRRVRDGAFPLSAHAGGTPLPRDAATSALTAASESGHRRSRPAWQVATTTSSSLPSAAWTQSTSSTSPTRRAVSSKSAWRSRVLASRRNERLSQREPVGRSSSLGRQGGERLLDDAHRVVGCLHDRRVERLARREHDRTPDRAPLANGETTSVSTPTPSGPERGSDAAPATIPIERSSRSASEISPSPSG